MPIGKVSWRAFANGMWLLGPAENIPNGALRRAIGTYPARGHGSIKSRSGSVLSHIGSFAAAVLSLMRFNGRRYASTSGGLFSWVDAATSLDTEPAGGWLSGGSAPAGNGAPYEFMELLSQFLATNPNLAADLGTISPNVDHLFISGAGTAWKLDAARQGSYWGIDAPSEAFVNALSMALGSQATKSITTFDIHQANAIHAGASGFSSAQDTTRKIEGTGAWRMTVPRDSEAISTGTFAPVSYTPLDLTTFTTPAVASSESDYIQFYVNVSRPRNLKTLGLKFFVQPSGTFNNAAFNQNPNVPEGTTAPYGSYFHIDLDVELAKPARKRALLAMGDFVLDATQDTKEERKMARWLRDNRGAPKDDLNALRFMYPTTVFVARNTWTKVSIPKGLFERAGNAGQSGYLWNNVVGLQISAESNKNGPVSVWWDDMRMVGGAGMRGDYQYTFTFRNDNTGARSNPPYTKATDGTVTLKTLGPIEVDRQSVTISGFPALLSATHFRGGAAASGAVVDNQVTHIEIWRTVGNGTPGKPNALFVDGGTSLEMFLVAKIAVGATSYLDITNDYSGLHPLAGVATLNPDQVMQFDNAPPWAVNAAIGSPRASTMGQAVFHQATGRVFFLDSSARGRVFYTPPGRPEGVSGFIEPTTPDDALQRLAVWNGNLYAVSQQFLFALEGDTEPFALRPVAGAPGTPFARTFIATPAGLFYVTQEGARLFTGEASTVVAEDAIGPIFRGTSVEGLPVFRARSGIGANHAPVASFGRDEVLVSDLAGVWGYHLPSDTWRYIPVDKVSALYHERLTGIDNAHGTVLAGFTAGANSRVVLFDGTAAGEQGGAVGEPTTDAIPTGVTAGIFDAMTPAVFTSGENRGIVRLIYLEADTSGQTLTVSVLLNGVESDVGTIVSSTKTRFEFNINRVADIAQVRVRSAAALATRIDISSIEIEVYESAGE